MSTSGWAARIPDASQISCSEYRQSAIRARRGFRKAKRCLFLKSFRRRKSMVQPLSYMPKALGLILRRERRSALPAGAKNDRFEKINTASPKTRLALDTNQVKTTAAACVLVLPHDFSGNTKLIWGRTAQAIRTRQSARLCVRNARGLTNSLC